MGRLINRPVPVTTDPEGRLLQFRWRGSWFNVAILEEWRDTGAWWQGEQEKVFYRVEGVGGVFELYRETPGSRWYLYKIYD
ncbi:MAG: DUF6504 family protein [Bacillota bacterium]